MNKPTELTTRELFDLGVAYGSFSIGDIDQGIHLVLPVCKVGSTEVTQNAVFQDLIDRDFYLIDYPEGWTSEYPYPYDYAVLGTLYINAIINWCKRHNIDIGR